MRWVALAAVVGLGCTTPNPRSCADGTCLDPAFPFCDVDGQIGGSVYGCVAVACTPGDVVACRSDGAVTCNTDGSNYEIAPCTNGCEVGVGCLACTSNDHCADGEPICDLEANSCRACIVDDECPSRVCNQGRCVDEGSVVYAAADGTASADCSVTAPCTPSRALTLATSRSPQPLIRLFPGTYLGGFEVSIPTATPVTVVATGATLEGVNGGLRVRAGANVSLRGATITGANDAVACEDAAVASTLVLERARVHGSMNLVATSMCHLTLSEVEIVSEGSNSVSAIGLASDTTFVGDRVHVHGSTTSFVQLAGQRVDLRLTNAILEDVAVVFATTDTQAPGSRASIGYSTFVMEAAISGIACVPNSGSGWRMVRIENNILVAPGHINAVEGTDCLLLSNIVFPQSGALVGNIVADPEFIDATNRDFRLRPTSPAIGRAAPASPVSSDHDFLGASRPQGGAPDLGAYEQ